MTGKRDRSADGRVKRKDCEGALQALQVDALEKN